MKRNMLGIISASNANNTVGSREHITVISFMIFLLVFSILTYTIITDVFNEAIESDAFATIIVFSVGVTLGALFEIKEFISDNCIKTNQQHGLTDTNYDVVFNVIGSLIASVYSVVFIF